MAERTLCAVITPEGADCDGPVPSDSPLNVCIVHLQQAYLYIRDILADQRGEGVTVDGRHMDTNPVRHPSASVVYYLRFRDMIKIGTTRDLWQRIGSIPHDRLLAIEPGGYELEAVRHEEFKAFRAARNREWFTDCSEICRHVNALRRTYGDPVEKRYHGGRQSPLAALLDSDHEGEAKRLGKTAAPRTDSRS
jgi:hypothetical protein